MHECSEPVGDCLVGDGSNGCIVRRHKAYHGSVLVDHEPLHPLFWRFFPQGTVNISWGLQKTFYSSDAGEAVRIATRIERHVRQDLPRIYKDSPGFLRFC